MSNSEILMCAPDYYGVHYVINPWMEGKVGTANQPVALEQWKKLTEHLQTIGVKLHFLDAKPDVPDLVFTANAALVWRNQAVISLFTHPERQGETAYNRAWFVDNGFTIRDLPDNILFEGAGDALFMLDDSNTPLPTLFSASGFRSGAGTAALLSELLDVETVPLNLVNPHFYHLDTCFCPLPDKKLLWYPPAFDLMSQARIEHHFAASDRYAVSRDIADIFACNAICANGTVIMNATEPELENWLHDAGFALIQTPLGEFIKAGGSAKCLTLRVK